MARDEVLLQSAIDSGICSLRWYTWSEATVSLGYFQKLEEFSTNPRFAGLAGVRRLSGGGAILHHHELTYACAIPANHPRAREPHDLYTGIHDSIRDVLVEHEIPVFQRGEDTPADPSGEPFLCFLRGAACDLVLGSHKILGSAQRRRQGAVLQHGSLVLRASEFAHEFPGLEELCGRKLDFGRLRRDLLQNVAGVLGQSAVSADMSPDEAELTHRLERDKYARLNWRH